VRAGSVWQAEWSQQFFEPLPSVLDSRQMSIKLAQINKNIEVVKGLKGEGRGVWRGKGEEGWLTYVILEGSELANHSLELHLPLLYLQRVTTYGNQHKARARASGDPCPPPWPVGGRSMPLLAPGTLDISSLEKDRVGQ
jgi:hypothetical protein